MKRSRRVAGLVVCGYFSFVGPTSVFAQLPSLKKQPWIGYFAVYEGNRFNFCITALGKIKIIPLNKKREAVAEDNQLSVSFGIEEVLADGKTRMKEIQKATLETAETATDELEKTVITGRVTGDAAFETTIEQRRGTISIGGRVTDVGTLTANPIRFTVRVNLPNVYSSVEKEGKKILKAFEKRIRGDRVDFTWTDGNHYRSSMDETVDVTSKEVNGTGISLAEIKMSYYGGRKLIFGASENSSISLSNDKPAPLYEGFTLHWLPDATQDPEGKARFAFHVK